MRFIATIIPSDGAAITFSDWQEDGTQVFPSSKRFSLNESLVILINGTEVAIEMSRDLFKAISPKPPGETRDEDTSASPTGGGEGSSSTSTATGAGAASPPSEFRAGSSSAATESDAIPFHYDAANGIVFFSLKYINLSAEKIRSLISRAADGGASASETSGESGNGSSSGEGSSSSGDSSSSTDGGSSASSSGTSSGGGSSSSTSSTSTPKMVAAVFIENIIEGTEHYANGYRFQPAQIIRFEHWYNAYNRGGARPNFSPVIAHPGGFGGDLWHLAGALALDETVQVRLIGKAEDGKTSKATQDLCNQVKKNKLYTVPNQSPPLDGSKKVDNGMAFQTVVQRKVRLAGSVLKIERGPTENYYGDTIASTSIIVNHCAKFGKTKTLDDLKLSFLSDFSGINPKKKEDDEQKSDIGPSSAFRELFEILPGRPGAAGVESGAGANSSDEDNDSANGDDDSDDRGKDKYDPMSDLQKLPLRAQVLSNIQDDLSNSSDNLPLLFVNMRIATGGQNLQHNITEPIFKGILGLATRHKLWVVRVGIPEQSPNSEKRKEAAWIKNYHDKTSELDIYAERCDLTDENEDQKLTPINKPLYDALFAEKTMQPFFWQAVNNFVAGKKSKMIGLIGGRSGGMDIAAWVGIRTVCWDRVGPTDKHYMRLHWATAFTSIIAYNGDIDVAALEYWIKGKDIVPILIGDEFARLSLNLVGPVPNANAEFFPPR